MWKSAINWANYAKKIKITQIHCKMLFFLVFLRFQSSFFFQSFIFFHSSLKFWPIITFYMAIESYGHVDYTCFIHFEKSQKMKALGHKNVILVKSRTSQPWTLPLDTFYIAKYPKIVQFSSVIPFWKAIKLLILEFLSVL